MLFMVIFVNLYSFITNIVPLNLCFSDDDTDDHSSARDTDRYIITSISDGMEFTVLWIDVSLFRVFGLVSMKICIVFAP